MKSQKILLCFKFGELWKFDLLLKALFACQIMLVHVIAQRIYSIFLIFLLFAGFIFFRHFIILCHFADLRMFFQVYILMGFTTIYEC